MCRPLPGHPPRRYAYDVERSTQEWRTKQDIKSAEIEVRKLEEEREREAALNVLRPNTVEIQNPKCAAVSASLANPRHSAPDAANFMAANGMPASFNTHIFWSS